jgi:hypothetical protein
MQQGVNVSMNRGDLSGWPGYRPAFRFSLRGRGFGRDPEIAAAA